MDSSNINSNGGQPLKPSLIADHLKRQAEAEAPYQPPPQPIQQVYNEIVEMVN